jgi:hypothetical protein
MQFVRKVGAFTIVATDTAMLFGAQSSFIRPLEAAIGWESVTGLCVTPNGSFRCEVTSIILRQ